MSHPQEILFVIGLLLVMGVLIYMICALLAGEDDLGARLQARRAALEEFNRALDRAAEWRT